MTTWVLIITLFMRNSTHGTAVATSIHSVDFKTRAACMQAAQMWGGQIKDVDAKSGRAIIRGKALCVPKYT